MINTLLLLSGNDIPFIKAQAIIHQPTLKEIAFIGENNFFIGCGFLNFSKDLLSGKDKVNLEKFNDFDILMSIMLNKDKALAKNIDCGLSVLSLIFPLYTVEVSREKGCIILKDKESKEFYLNKDNFNDFKKILIEMFNLKMNNKNLPTNFNPSGSMAQRIADKLKKRHEQLAQINGDVGKEIRVFSRYVSILSVGVKKSFEELMNYTVFQLYDEFQRFTLKSQYDIYIKAKLAGAKNLKDVEDWTKDIHDKNNKK